jgi:hypothetical protein
VADPSRRLEEQAELIERLRRSLTAVVEDNNDLRVSPRTARRGSSPNQTRLAGIQRDSEKVSSPAPRADDRAARGDREAADGDGGPR